MPLLNFWRRTPEKIDKDLDAEIAKEDARGNQEDVDDPNFAFSLMREALKVAKSRLQEQRVDPDNFRNKQGFLLMGKQSRTKPFDFKFDNKRVSKFMNEVAKRENEEKEEEAILPDKVFYRQERTSGQAEVIEALMTDMIRFIVGKNVDVQVVVTSKVDNRVNSTDLALIIRNEEGLIEQVLGFDFSSVSRDKQVQRKMRLIVRGIVRGWLTTLLYMCAPNKKGEMEYFQARGVARALIGVSRKTALLFAKEWMKPNPDLGDALSADTRLGFLYTILANYRGQLIQSKKQDQQKGGEESLATKELERAQAWFQKIIDTDFPDQRKTKEEGKLTPHRDNTLRGIDEFVNSRDKMGNIYDRAVKSQAAIDRKLDKENGQG